MIRHSVRLQILISSTFFHHHNKQSKWEFYKTHKFWGDCHLIETVEIILKNSQGWFGQTIILQMITFFCFFSVMQLKYFSHCNAALCSYEGSQTNKALWYILAQMAVQSTDVSKFWSVWILVVDHSFQSEMLTSLQYMARTKWALMLCGVSEVLIWFLPHSGGCLSLTYDI